MIRTVMVDTTPLPILDYNYSIKRNAVVDNTMNLPGEETVVGGEYMVSGSFTAAYRPELFNPIVNNSILGQSTGGVSSTFPTHIITMGDTNQSWSFASCALTGCSISSKSKELSKITIDWIGLYKLPTAIPMIQPSYDFSPSLFYNTSINGMKCKGLTIDIRREISADDYILGSEYSQTLYQSSNLTIGGTINLQTYDYDMLDKLITTTDESTWDTPSTTKVNNIEWGTITTTFRNFTGTANTGSITIDHVKLIEGSVNVNGRQKIEKNLNWKSTSTSTSGILITP